MGDIKLKLDPPVAEITLNRPRVRNALSPPLVKAFHQALDQVRRDQNIAALVVTGAGKAFCGGADLRLLQEMIDRPIEEIRQDTAGLMHLFRSIYEFPKPVIAAVNGPALGGGCGLASVCDVVLAAEEAVFGYTETKVGFVPALVAVFLIRTCGERKARELLLTGRIFASLEAREIGLVNEITTGEELLGKARRMAKRISRNSPLALRLTKELIAHLQGAGLDEALKLALQVNVLMRTSADFREGVSSFLEKRPPEWKRK